MTPPAVSCVLLDMGNVLLGLDYEIFGLKMAAVTGIGQEKLREVFHCGSLVEAYESGLVDERAFHREVCRRIRRRIPWNDFADAWNSIFQNRPLLPEALLAALSARTQLWVLSNTNETHFNFICNRYSFVRHFRGYVLSHEVGSRKPDARIYSHALESAGVKASQALFVDDLLPNVEAARRLGIDAFQFQGEEHFARELKVRNLV